MPAIICGAGHGKVLDGQTSKLVDAVGNKSAIVQVVDSLKQAEIFSPIIVVINPILGGKIVDQLLEAGHGDIEIAYQLRRAGAANATLCGLKELRKFSNARSFLTMFGETPLFQPEVLRELGLAHMQQQTKLTLMTCPHDTGHPLTPHVEKYAHLKAGWDDSYRQEEFLRVYHHLPAADGDDLISSIYCFDGEWFEQYYPLIPGKNKGDQWGDEYHLPYYVDIAVRTGSRYCNIRKPNIQWQILGYNNLQDYKVINQVYQQMHLQASSIS